MSEVKYRECTLMNVEISEDRRHFGGLLDPLEDEDFVRIFNVLIDEETGKTLERSGWNFSVRRRSKREREEDSGLPYALVVKVDYDLYEPTIEVVTEAKTVNLNEARISCLDSMNIDFANITIVQGGLYNEKGKKIWTQAILKDMKVYSI